MANRHIQVLVDSIGDSDDSHSHNAIERTPLRNATQRRVRVGLRSKCRKRCCVTSKAALLILCWNLFITILLAQWLDTSNYLLIPNIVDKTKIQKATPIFLSFLALLYFFFPLAGCLADIRCGRYKTVVRSLWFIFWSGVFLMIGALVIASTKLYLSNRVNQNHSTVVATSVLAAIGFGPPTLFGGLLLLTSYIGFSANVIQFGIDQLHDSPSEDSTIFINWFVFTYNLGLAVSQIMWTSYNIRRDTYVLPITPILMVILLGLSLYIARRKHQWFLVDSGSRNPYKLVYSVIKFAAQHKVPVRRSAFTYCEDELPTRMDLGKEKYGGPFTTEQVEDVKAFLGILCLLLTLGPVFMVSVAVDRLLFMFPIHLKTPSEKHSPLSYLMEYVVHGGFPKLLITIFIPVHICLL